MISRNHDPLMFTSGRNGSMLVAFLQGVILAIGLILPLGVQNVFIFNQGASQPSYRSVLPVLFTAAICDTFLIGFAVGGISLLVFSIPWVKSTIFIVGILFLTYMGYLIWRAKPAPLSRDNTQPHMTTKQQILFTLSVSLLNPHAIVDSVGVIGTSSLSYMGMEKVVFMMACICISWVWFFSLGFAGHQMKRLSSADKILRYLNKTSACIMWGTAVYFLYLLVW